MELSENRKGLVEYAKRRIYNAMSVHRSLNLNAFWINKDCYPKMAAALHNPVEFPGFIEHLVIMKKYGQ